MTYDEKVQWLLRYQDSLRKERELAEELEQMRTRAYKVTPALTGMPGGPSDGQSLPRAVENIVKVQQELQCQINQCGAVRREIVAVLDQVSNPRDHEILRRKYLLNETWEKIAVAMYYSYKQVRRRHRACVEALTLPDAGKDVLQCPI
ncbi:MAG: hypothetical protein ACI4KC_07730 [Gemmiger sp.]